MSEIHPDLPPDLLLDREAIEAARRSAFAVATHRPEDFDGMRRAGRLAAEILDLLVPEVAPGVTTARLDKLAFEYAMDHGALPACLGYRGYRHTLCTSINHVVCHGIPADRPVKDGDILNIDVTLVLDGWHGTPAGMYYARRGEGAKPQPVLVEITYEAMMTRHSRRELTPHHWRHRVTPASRPCAEEQERCLGGAPISAATGWGGCFTRAAQHRSLRPSGQVRGAEARMFFTVER